MNQLSSIAKAPAHEPVAQTQSPALVPRCEARLKLGKPQAERAFTRLDLMVLIGLVVLLASWFGAGRIGERGRIAKCAANLTVLGQSMQGFGNDHGDALPPAIVEMQQVTWDAQLAPYLPANLTQHGIDPLFKCPSDQLPHARTRSYTMSAHDMQNENWPIGPENATGVGLVWNQESISRLLGEQALRAAATNIDCLAMVKRTFIPSPANTVVLTELINSDNNLKGIRWSVIGGANFTGPGQQLEQLLHNQTCIHDGRYNYLMLDGHVELLSPLQAGALKIWNISKAN
jgi:prepilin-type processing-associated H-X9-DG protein